MRNPFKRRKKIRKIDKNNVQEFLKKVSMAVDQTFSGQESSSLEELYRKELKAWIEKTIEKGDILDADAVKLGVCLGLFETLRKVNEAEEKENVSYVS